MNKSPKGVATVRSCLESCDGPDGCGSKQFAIWQGLRGWSGPRLGKSEALPEHCHAPQTGLQMVEGDEVTQALFCPERLL